MEKKLINKNQEALLKLLEARIHLGHKKGYWSPKVAPYLYGTRQGIHIIDLKKSISFLSKSLFMILDILKNKRNKILIVGNKRENSLFTRSLKLSNRSNQIAFVDRKWVGGSLTNRKLTKEFIYSEEYTQNSNLKYSSNKKLFQMPNLIVLLNPNDYVLREAYNLNIPVIGILDSNTDPKYFSYPIPGNDDSISSHYFYIEILAYLINQTLLRDKKWSLSK